MLYEVITIALYLDEMNVVNRERVRNIKGESVDWFKSAYPKKFRFSQLEEMLALWGEEDEASVEIVRDELNRFSHLSHALEMMDFRAVFKIFMNRLRQKSIDRNNFV